MRGGAVVARWAHNPKVASSILAPATKWMSVCRTAALIQNGSETVTRTIGDERANVRRSAKTSEQSQGL